MPSTTSVPKSPGAGRLGPTPKIDVIKKHLKVKPVQTRKRKVLLDGMEGARTDANAISSASSDDDSVNIVKKKRCKILERTRRPGLLISLPGGGGDLQRSSPLESLSVTEPVWESYRRYVNDFVEFSKKGRKELAQGTKSAVDWAIDIDLWPSRRRIWCLELALSFPSC